MEETHYPHQVIFHNSHLMKLSRPHSNKQNQSVIKKKLNLFVNLVFNSRTLSNAECHHIKLSVMSEACHPNLRQEAEAEGLSSQDYPELCSELCLGLGYALELNLGLGCTLVLYQN